MDLKLKDCMQRTGSGMPAIDTTHPTARFGKQNKNINLISVLDIVLVNKKLKK